MEDNILLTPKYNLAYGIWMEYFYETEKFTRRLEDNPDEYKGIPIEETTEQIIQINSTAWWTYIYTMQKHLAIDDETWQNARDNAVKVEWLSLVKWSENRAEIVI